MQPEWRRKSRRGNDTWPLKRIPFPQHEAWPELKHRGENGIFLLLLGLGWWMSSVQSAKDRKPWISAIDDLLWVLQHFERERE